VNKLFFLLLFISSSFKVFGQEARHTNTLTFGVGGMPYSYNSDFQRGGPTFTGNYEYRLSTYLAVEGGTDILFPSIKYWQPPAVIPPGQNLLIGPGCSVCPFPISDRSRVTLLTYGLKGILPLARNRVELFAELGGAYAWNSELGGHLNAFLGQASLGGRLALDSGHRFWLGTTLRGFTNFGSSKQAWVPLTLDLGIRFGH
jgi:hypothetical protein